MLRLLFVLCFAFLAGAVATTGLDPADWRELPQDVREFDWPSIDAIEEIYAEVREDVFSETPRNTRRSTDVEIVRDWPELDPKPAPIPAPVGTSETFGSPDTDVPQAAEPTPDPDATEPEIPQSLPMPDVVGAWQTDLETVFADAANTLQERVTYTIHFEIVHDFALAGRVIRQSPAAGQPVDGKSEISMTVAQWRPIMVDQGPQAEVSPRPEGTPTPPSRNDPLRGTWVDSKGGNHTFEWLGEDTEWNVPGSPTVWCTAWARAVIELNISLADGLTWDEALAIEHVTLQGHVDGNAALLEAHREIAHQSSVNAEHWADFTSTGTSSIDITAGYGNLIERGEAWVAAWDTVNSHLAANCYPLATYHG